MSDKLLQQIRGLGFLQKMTLFLEFSSELHREAHNTAGMPVDQKFDVLKLTDEGLRKMFGAKIRIMRKLRGLTQQELANKIDATQSTITNVENGRRAPSLKNLVGFATALNVSADWLLDIQGENYE